LLKIHSRNFSTSDIFTGFVNYFILHCHATCFRKWVSKAINLSFKGDKYNENNNFYQ
jgi:hypothetical protein